MALSLLDNDTVTIINTTTTTTTTTLAPDLYTDNLNDSSSEMPGTTDNNNNSPQDPQPPHSLVTIALLSLLFFVIVLVGIVGNALVVFVVLRDRKMRQSVTNLLILNLALADLVIMVLGVPEIVQFMLDQGWLLGALPCRVNRFVLVVCLYVSVLSLVSVCVERFIAIVFPIKAHVVCTRRKVFYVISAIWPASILCGLPTILFNRVATIPVFPGVRQQCIIVFPDPHLRHFLIFKLLESALFYFVPLIVQVILYTVVIKRLFSSMDELHTRFQLRSGESSRAERGSDRAVETIRARKGVVKMLVSSVIIYTISYSPHQVHLLYNTFSPTRLHDSWTFFVFVMVMTHINSAANPVLYSIFSQNFRRNFKRFLCYACYAKDRHEYRRTRFDSFLDSRGASRRISTTMRTTVSRL
ncbi:neuropeptide receptor 15-like [Babylonia areolata]|uniref:neuropeptide receptor 15-like n=1 Tax=Babylonia areolata TaxID=304850 RepID=UPI003FD664A0